MAAFRSFLLVSSASLFLTVASSPPEFHCSAYENIAARKGTRCANDGNPCTMVDCSSGVDKYINRPDTTPCTLGKNNGVCNAGQCKLACAADPSTCKCTVDAHCPAGTTECMTWGCNIGDGMCEGTPQLTGEPIKEQTPGDCRVLVCNSKGTSVSQVDDDDKPAGKECIIGACSNGISMSTFVNVGTACSTGVCDGKGACVECLARVDWNACGGMNCPVKLCLGEVCNSGVNDQCNSGHCADGLCCNEACTGECMSCELTESRGTCVNVPYYDNDPQYAEGKETCDSSKKQGCNGEGKCLKKITADCAFGQQCISGTCESMVCMGAAGEPCNKNSECASGVCSAYCKGKTNDPCRKDTDCESNVCNAGSCS